MPPRNIFRSSSGVWISISRRNESIFTPSLVSLEERLPEKAEGEKLLAEILPDTQKDPRSTLEGKLVGEAVHGVLNVLTEKESSVLRLNLIEEKTHSEISDLLKMPKFQISDKEIQNIISAVVNTFNEEKNIGRCLPSLPWADEIIVVDM